MAERAQSSLVARVIAQFGKPSGVLGRLVGWILANRGSNVRRNRFTVDKLALKDGDRLLEIGCGPGVAIGYALAAAPGISCVGLDHSDVMIEMARSRNRIDAKSGRLHLVVGGLERLAFAGRGFHKVMMINVAMFVKDRPAMFAKLKGIMEAGARIAVTHQPRNPGAKDSEGEAFATTVAAELADAGFKNVRTETLLLKPVAAQCVIAET